jgi:hypothetical protein
MATRPRTPKTWPRIDQISNIAQGVRLREAHLHRLADLGADEICGARLVTKQL